MAVLFQISSLVHNNIDIIKKALFDNGSMSSEELIEPIQSGMLSSPTKREALGLYIMPALTKQKFFTQNSEGKWELVFEQIPEHQIIKDFLDQIKKPMTLKEIKRELKKQGISLNNLNAITLDRDPNFIKLKGEYWSLIKWNIINDEAYEIIQSAGIPMTKEDVLKKINKVNWTKNKELLFCPEVDERFTKIGKKWNVKVLKNKSTGLKEGSKEAEKILSVLEQGSQEQVLDAIISLRKDSNFDIQFFIEQSSPECLERLIGSLLDKCDHKNKGIVQEAITTLGEFGRPIYNKKSIFKYASNKRSIVIETLLRMVDRAVSAKDKEAASHIINQLIKIKTEPQEIAKVKAVVTNIPSTEEWASVKILAGKL